MRLCSSANWRQWSMTGHVRQMAVAVVWSSGMVLNQRSGSWLRQAAWCLQSVI